MNDVGRTVEYDGKLFKCVADDDGQGTCSRCAFSDEVKGDHWAPGHCRDSPCDGGYYKLVGISVPSAKILEPVAISLADLKARICDIDGLKPQTDSKPTNPKDAIGVRKVNLSCVPAGVMMETAVALMEGAAKYGRHNYRGVGVRASVYYDAAAGHLMDWWEGDDIDQESGLSHVTKAIASLVVLRDAMLQGKLTDDRPPRSKIFKRDFNPLAAEVLDRHKDKNPKHWTIADEAAPEGNTATK